jgi:hypothetical protein
LSQPTAQQVNPADLVNSAADLFVRGTPPARPVIRGIKNIKHPFFWFVWGLVGFLIGNRFALNRDKRKEFNNLIEPLRHDLIGVKNYPNSGIKGSWMITVALIREKLPIWKRKGFDKAVENFNKSKSEENIERDNLGGFT